MMSNPTAQNPKATLGWREWVCLPDLGLPWIKAKIDTGARTSALHASDIEYFDRDGVEWVRFKVQPKQYSDKHVVEVEAELVDQRHVRSSGGRKTFRPVIKTTVAIQDQKFETEITLICRKRMKFRMLIGRQAMKDRFLVDPGESYCSGVKPRRQSTKRLL
jgi:hypothetical protein